MSKKTKTPDRRPAAVPRTRAVFELRPQQGKAQQVEASTPAELAAHLARVLGTDPQDSRAAAHMLHVCRAALVAPKWSARRVGVLVFQPDQAQDGPQGQQQRNAEEAGGKPAGNDQPRAQDAAQQPGSRQAAGTQPEAATPAQDTLDEPDSQDSQGR